jgi:hypothetical protein
MILRLAQNQNLGLWSPLYSRPRKGQRWQNGGFVRQRQAVDIQISKLPFTS